MLTGRRSLERIIGKRRRFLPNRDAIVAAPFSSEIYFHGSTSESNVGRFVEEKWNFSCADSETEVVSCPVCLAEFDCALINSHLDECLSKGRKRKLRQLTLLQFNFSGPKSDVLSKKFERDVNEVTPIHGNCISSSNVWDLNSYDVSQGEYKQHSVSPECIETRFRAPQAGTEIDTHIAVEDDFDVSNILIPTSIVGRRFVSKKDVDSSLRICLRRDPENEMDQNALKVLYANHESDIMLGYVPRELAQHLSPLIDKFHLIFEGHIITIPKDTGEAVPIQIACKNFELCNPTILDNIQEFTYLWRNVLCTIELSKMTKYQQKLRLLIQEVLRSDSHLFSLSEMSFLEAFKSLSNDSQRLFARLYMRKGPWFRLSKISYSEISDCCQAAKELLEVGYLRSSELLNEVEMEQVLGTLTLRELQEALCLLRKKYIHSKRKQDMIDLLLSSNKDGHSTELQRLILKITGSCVEVSPSAEALIWRAERLFFLNGEQDLSAFSLIDLGIMKYPIYKCINNEPVFSTREDLVSYEAAIEVSQIMVESIDQNKSELVLRCIDISLSRMLIISEEVCLSSFGPATAFLLHFSASWVYSKVVSLGVSYLERMKRYLDATNLLKQLLRIFSSDGRRGRWTLRLSIDLEHLGNVDESLCVAENGLSDSWVRAGSKIALQRRILRFGKPPRRWKLPSFSMSVTKKICEVHVQGRPLNCETGRKSVFYSENGEQCGVEQLALQYYTVECGCGWQGVHSESGIWLTIFGILMWDVIFADIPNVFRTKFQTAPLDLETDSFYNSRESLIEAQLKKIEEGMGEEIVIIVWNSWFGTACRGVNWEKHSMYDLRTAVKCIGGSCLASICRHLAHDYSSWSKGMPDLLLWRLNDDCCSGEAKLVEVKGPNDRLSEQQRAWLLVLMDIGFSVEVCKVTPPLPK